VDASGKEIPISLARTFILPGTDVTIHAEFDNLPVDTYLITMDPMVNGSLSVPDTGLKGSTVTVVVRPDRWYKLKPGSLYYRDATGKSFPIGDSLQFTMPESHVTLGGEFISFNATLAEIKMDGSPLPGFSPELTKYMITVPYHKTTVDLSFRTTEPNAVMQPGDGKQHLEDLQIFDNFSVIEVTAQDGTTKLKYELTIVRQLIPQASVPSGSFQWGSSVFSVSDFSMGKFEVTQEQWEVVFGPGNKPSAFQSDNTPGEVWYKRPVESISWYNALVFCNRLSIAEHRIPVYTIRNSTNPDEWGSVPMGRNADWDKVKADWTANGYRLPTEMEWVWAAMGADSQDKNAVNLHGINKYFAGYNGQNGSDLRAYAWFESNSTGVTHEVGKKLPNELDLYDMSGNVKEFCWDWYGDLPSGNHRDYRGPDKTQSLRLIHGGSYESFVGYIAFTERGTTDVKLPNPTPYEKNKTIGMRVVCQD
jgi:formylglycine-generating enzyme required for sulfatase activity